MAKPKAPSRKASKVKVSMGGTASGNAPRYEKTDGARQRFWQVERRANVVSTWSGVVGKPARRTVRTLADERRAKIVVEELVETKRGEGYARVQREARDVGAVRGVSERNAALEAAIDADPDDVLGYAVYGDWLETRGDPRGALIAAQRACLERPDDPKPPARAKRILETYAAELLGPLARFKGSTFSMRGFHFRLGFIERARLHRRSTAPLLSDLVRILLEHPSGRFLRHLTLGPADLPKTRVGYGPTLEALARLAPKTLRSVHLAEASAAPLGDVSLLFRSPLDLHRVTLTGRGLRVGDVAPPSLRELSIAPDDYESLPALLHPGAQYPALTRLRVDVRGTSEAELLCATREQLPSLRHLIVHATHGHEEVYGRTQPRAWMWPILPHLRELDLDVASFGNRSATHLMNNAASFRHLLRLRLPKHAELNPRSRQLLMAALPNIEWSGFSYDEPFEVVPEG